MRLKRRFFCLLMCIVIFIMLFTHVVSAVGVSDSSSSGYFSRWGFDTCFFMELDNSLPDQSHRIYQNFMFPRRLDSDGFGYEQDVSSNLLDNPYVYFNVSDLTFYYANIFLEYNNGLYGQYDYTFSVLDYNSNTYGQNSILMYLNYGDTITMDSFYVFSFTFNFNDKFISFNDASNTPILFIYLDYDYLDGVIFTPRYSFTSDGLDYYDFTGDVELYVGGYDVVLQEAQGELAEVTLLTLGMRFFNKRLPNMLSANFDMSLSDYNLFLSDIVDNEFYMDISSISELWFVMRLYIDDPLDIDIYLISEGSYSKYYDLSFDIEPYSGSRGTQYFGFSGGGFILDKGTYTDGLTFSAAFSNIVPSSDPIDVVVDFKITILVVNKFATQTGGYITNTTEKSFSSLTQYSLSSDSPLTIVAPGGISDQYWSSDREVFVSDISVTFNFDPYSRYIDVFNLTLHNFHYYYSDSGIGDYSSWVNHYFTNIPTSDGLADFNMLDWLVDAVDSFLNTNLFYNVSLGDILWFCVGFGSLFAVLKYFAGG